MSETSPVVPSVQSADTAINPLSVPDGTIAPAQTSPTASYKTYLLALLIVLLGGLIAAAVVFYQPFMNYLVLKNANPAMISLAEQAGMSRQGELVFLRSDPQLATDAQMSTDCAGNAAANNKNGFIEQGCYVPDPGNVTRGHIFIRQMPANLYNEEIVTAAYEMLHSVYLSQNSPQLIQAIESNYSHIHNASLNAQVVNFASTEPGYRDLELFSLLGTQYTSLSPALEAYYAPYFANRSLTVSNYTRVTTLFQSEQTQLNQLQAAIAAEASSANQAYADSVAWAKAGNATEDTYDYNIYKNYVAEENANINQYNQLSKAYNALVTEYDGTQPVAHINQVTTNSSS